MRQLLVGVALVVSALIVTFATALILQGIAASKRATVVEPFNVEKIPPAAGPRGPGARSPILASGRGTEL